MVVLDEDSVSISTVPYKEDSSTVVVPRDSVNSAGTHEDMSADSGVGDG